MRPTATASFKTTRLSLSLVREADRENLIALERDPQVMRFLNGGRSIPDEGENGPVSSRLAAAKTTCGRRARGARMFSLRPVDEGVAELGYRLGREAWGRGFASEGAAALVVRGFADMGFAHRRTAMTVHAARDGPGEGGPHLCANCLSGRGRLLSGNRTGRRQVRDNARGMGAARPVRLTASAWARPD